MKQIKDSAHRNEDSRPHMPRLRPRAAKYTIKINIKKDSRRTQIDFQVTDEGAGRDALSQHQTVHNSLSLQ